MPERSLRARAVVAGVAAAFLSVACGGGGGGGGSNNGTSGTAKDLASVTPNPVTAAISTGPGQFAADYLRGTNFDHLLVEIDYPQGRAPTDAARTLLEDRLLERCGKSAGVTLMLDEALPPETFLPVMSLADVQAIEDAHRSQFSNLATKTVALYVLYTTGASDEDGPNGVIVGYAHRGGSVVIFIDNATGAGPLITDAEVEGYTLVHEIGHMLGLVNNGVPMVAWHEDLSHPAHDTNSDSVMWWKVNISAIGPSIGDPDFAQFGPECIADVQAFGGL